MPRLIANRIKSGALTLAEARALYPRWFAAAKALLDEEGWQPEAEEEA